MKHKHSRAFTLELLLLTLALLLSLCVLVRVFGAAAKHEQAARQTTAATLILQNAAARFTAGDEAFASLCAQLCAGGEGGAVTLCYDENGAMAESGGYTAQAVLHAAPAGAGTLVTADLTVCGADGAALAAQAVQRYFPGEGGGA